MTEISQPAWTTEMQEQAREIMAAFREHDLAELAGMTPDEREAQAAARFAVVLHVTRIWERPERDSDGVVHATHVPGFGPVAALLDVVNELLANVQVTQADAGDEEGELP